MSVLPGDRGEGMSQEARDPALLEHTLSIWLSIYLCQDSFEKRYEEEVQGEIRSLSYLLKLRFVG